MKTSKTIFQNVSKPMSTPQHTTTVAEMKAQIRARALADARADNATRKRTSDAASFSVVQAQCDQMKSAAIARRRGLCKETSR
jgi:hypothetical protein